MKIAVFHNLPSGGAKRALAEFCRRLSGLGHTLSLYIPDTANEVYLPLDDTVKRKRVYETPFGRLIQRIRKHGSLLARFIALNLDVLGQSVVQRRIAEDINAGEYDLAFVHECMVVHNPFVLRWLRIPTIYYAQEHPREIHEFHLRKDPSLVARMRHLYVKATIGTLARRNIKYATNVVVNSYFSRETMLRTYGIECQVCYLGVDTNKFHPLEDIKKGDFVLSVGGLQHYKGFGFIINALSKITPQVRPRLVIVADRVDEIERRRLVKSAESMEVCLDILEKVTDEELCLLYNQALIVVYTPILEPFGLVAIESMACGTPVIGVREGGVRESIVDKQTGFLLDRSASVFARTIELLLRDEKMRQSMGEACVEYVRREWNWDSSVACLMEIFATATEKG